MELLKGEEGEEEASAQLDLEGEEEASAQLDLEGVEGASLVRLVQEEGVEALASQVVMVQEEGVEALASQVVMVQEEEGEASLVIQEGRQVEVVSQVTEMVQKEEEVTRVVQRGVGRLVSKVVQAVLERQAAGVATPQVKRVGEEEVLQKPWPSMESRE